MSIINWATGTSGTWSIGGNWVGGMAPGTMDTALIAAAGSYTVTMTQPEVVAGVTLDDAAAVLQVDSSLTASFMMLEAGTLALGNGAALAGTLTEMKGSSVLLDYGASATLNNLTAVGKLTITDGSGAYPQGTLTILDGLTLLASNGKGPGSAVLNGPVTLDGVSSLNNETITVTTDQAIAVTNTATLTLGAGLTLTANLTDSSTLTVISNGSLTADTAAADGVFVNNGMLNVAIPSSGIDGFPSLYGFGFESFTNNGTISVSQALLLNLSAIQAAGAGAAIDLDGGSLGLVGSLTTAQLLTLYADQHISGVAGSGYGFVVDGTLNNAGATLMLGPDSTLGALTYSFNASGSETITGGTIVDAAGGGTILGNFTTANSVLQDLHLISNNPTLMLGYMTLANDTISGPGSVYLGGNEVFTQDAFHGVSEFSVVGFDLTLAGTTFLGLPGGPTINVSGSGTVSLAADQSVNGMTVNLAYGSSVELAAGRTYNNLTITNEQSNGTLSLAGAGTYTLGGQSNVLVDYGSPLDLLAEYSGTVFDNKGTITVTNGAGFGASPTALTFVNDGVIAGPDSGVISLSNLLNRGTINLSAGSSAPGLLYLTGLTNTGVISATSLQTDIGSLHNTGTIDISGGTVTAAGSMTAHQYAHFLSELTTTDVTDSVSGTLDLAGATVAVSSFGSSFLLAYASSITDGTLAIGNGDDVSAPFNAVISAAIINDGTLQLGNSVVGAGITGTGTIDVGGAAVQGPGPVFDGAVGAGQTLVFAAGSTGTVLGFGSAAASSGFAGTLSGFAAMDGLAFTGETVTSGKFVGSSIQISFKGGGTLSIATDTALTGTLAVVKGGTELVYGSVAPGLHDWSGAAALSMSGQAEFSAGAAGPGGAVRDDLANFEWVMAHHGVHGGLGRV